MTTKTTAEEAEKLADKYGTNTAILAHFYFHRLAALIDEVREKAIAEHLAKQSAPVLPVVAYYGKGKDGCDSVNLKENKLLRDFDPGETVAEPLCKVSDALAAIAALGVAK